MGIAVGLGAFGAHGLESYLPTRFEDADQRLANWDTAVKYQMVHALGIICLGLVARGGMTRSIDLSGWMLTAGIALFSGCLYGWVLLDSKPLVMVVPVGGLAFIAGWVLFAFGVATQNREK